MQTFIHGTDKGNALLMALVLIIILSTTFMSLLPRISAIKQYSQNYKVQVIQNIERNNMEILRQYDFD